MRENAGSHGLSRQKWRRLWQRAVSLGLLAGLCYPMAVLADESTAPIGKSVTLT